MADLHAWLTLSLAPRLGPVLFHRLLAAFSSPERVLAASRQELARVPGVGEKFLARFKPDEMKAAADEQLAQAEKCKARILHFQHEDYPDILRHIYRPPLILYAQGDPALLAREAVAIVGSRAATVYGRKVAHQFAATLAGAGLVVVSGVALGIDAAAHRGALTSGATIGVLGCGLDYIYPRQHGALYDEIREQGLLLTENPFGTKPEPFRFPARNRIISGLSRGVVVVEAARRSGSLITAQLALEQGREVFAVPGRIDSGKSQGAHGLLRQGAILVNSADDILAELGQVCAVSTAADSSLEAPLLSPDEKKIYDLLDVYGLSIDDIIQLTGMRAEKVAELMLLMELKGVVCALPGNQYQRLDSLSAEGKA